VLNAHIHHTSPALSAVNNTAPVALSGHDSAAPGSPAKNVAHAAIHQVAPLAMCAHTSAAVGANGARKVADSPKMVAGASAGAAATFAGTEYNDTYGCKNNKIGPTASCAAIGTASA
jgi:hypothetical protein